MTIELGISVAAIFFGIIGFAFGSICLKRYRNCVALFELQGGQLEDVEKVLAESQQRFEANSAKIADNTRRIAWLETRVRQPKTNEPETLSDIIHSNSQPVLQTTNITERRHRVLSLAARGQDVEMIAATLGMLEVEVELILNLHKVA